MGDGDNAGALAREEALWAGYAAPLAALRKQLRAEFEARALEEEWTPLAVFALAGRVLALVTAPGSSLPRLLEQGNGPPSTWTCVLDFADEAESPEFILGDMVVDPAGIFLAYTVDVTGADRFAVRVRRLDRGPSRTVAESAAPSLAWDAAADRVLYLAVTPHLRPVQLRAVRPASGLDELLEEWEACDEHGEYIELFTSSDGAQVLAAKELHSRRSIWLLDRTRGRLVPLLAARTGDGAGSVSGSGVRVLADIRGRHCAAIVSDGRSPDALIMTDALLMTEPTPDSSWNTVYRSEPGSHLEDLTLSDGHIEVVVRHGGGQRLVRIGLSDADRRDVVFSDDGTDGTEGTELSAIELTGGLRAPGRGVDLVRSSWHAPSRWHRLDVRGEMASPVCPQAGQRDGSPRAKVLNLEAESADGTQVPLTMLRPPGYPGPLPTVLYAYGAYGLAVETSYSIFRLSLFDRGIAFAVAHVRGGGEHGRAWHEAGRGAGKLRAVEDYLACARRLIDAGLTLPAGVVARARSAGGAIVGAAINREPALFAAGVLEVPFVDCLATLLRPDDPLTALEWDEWGNPVEDADAREALAALSPVENVRPAAYPALLLTAGLSDVRVQVTEQLRYVAAVRAASTSGRPVLLRAQEFGHLGPSDAADDQRGEAEILSFILRETGRAGGDGG